MNSTEKRIRVILADDHELLRRGFQSLLLFNDEIELVTHVSNGEELCKAVTRYLPDIVITDIKMPVMDGIEAARLIKSDYPDIKVIALSNFQESAMIEEMIEAGASGYMVKNISRQELIKGIHSVMQGKTFFCEESLETFLKSKVSQQPEPKREIEFSKREIEILCLTGRGKSSQEIAEALSLSIRTIEWHRQCLKSKIGVNNTNGIVVYAIRHGYE